MNNNRTTAQPAVPAGTVLRSLYASGMTFRVEDVAIIDGEAHFTGHFITDGVTVAKATRMTLAADDWAI